MNQEQLKKGLDSTGKQLPPYTSPYARKKGVSKTPKTLNDKGGFYKGFYVLAFDKFIEMGSRDWKEAILENKWGHIHGLTEENLQEFRDLFIPIYTRNLTNAILQA
jgi:hypothetical protein